MSEAPLLQAVLGPEDRAELLRDLTALAEIDSAQIHDARGTRVCRLDEAFAALEDGTAERALLRYHFDGQAWLDTLMAEPGGVRLVRMADVGAADADAPKR